MFYVKYVITLILFVIAAVGSPIIIRGLQQIASILVDTIEQTFMIPPEYMVLAQMADIEGKLAFLMFAAIILNIIFMFKFAAASISKLKTRVTKPKSV